MTVRQESLTLISASFFGWGVLRALQDILVIADQVQRPDHDARAMLVHFSFFVGYLLLPIPASKLIRRFGLRMGLAGACGIMGAGALLCGMAGRHSSQLPCLAYIFAIAAGIAVLQTAGNPSVTLLGQPQTGARRLLGAQTVLALGSALAPLCVTLGHSAFSPDPASMLKHARIVYFAVGALVLSLAVTFGLRSRDGIPFNPVIENSSEPHLRLQRPMVFALVAIFLFVGTEATVISHILRYQLSFSGKALAPVLPWTSTLSIYWIIVMAGRMLSYGMLRRFNLIGLLQGTALLGVLLVSSALLWSGDIGLVALLATGLVNAAIFPLIFCSVTECLNEQQMATASGWLMTAMCGGAVIPLMSGAAADHLGLKAAFVIPILSYLWIACTASRCRQKASAQVRESGENTLLVAGVSNS
jgi:FHS family L-fucose permease-like MFS transporter